MIPRRVIDSLKCALCKNGLSIFPIHSYGDTDMVTCGRCPLQNAFLPQREHLYEQLAQHIEFSCRYESDGCIERLKPNELQDHESNCPHKPCSCPILPLGACQWQGDYKDLREHCLEAHAAATLDANQLELDIVTPHEENYVFCQADQTFIGQLKCDVTNNKLYWNVISCDLKPKMMTFSYRVRFTNNAARLEYSSDEYNVRFTDSFDFVICDTTACININDIIVNLNEPTCIICEIDINVTSTISSKPKILQEDEDEMLKALECPVCFDYMVPPIAQCITGHSFCSSHKDSLPEPKLCPAGCASTIGDTRNFLLEQITNIIEYPCKYNKYGCAHTANAKIIKDHEASCIHGPYKCIIETCQWENKYSELKNHLLQNHKDNILEINSITYIIDKSLPDQSNSYVIATNDNIFKLLFKQEADAFLWSLQVVDSNVDFSKYMLELDFTSQNKEKIYIRKQCAPLNNDFDNDVFIELKCNQLRTFINDDLLLYKVRVVEVN
ncbi:hypothetical protein AMK59_2504 [Oryctes borbonicus]|uniref:RING-type E3 ubiquitin transferase n=1 Tax=Oryctes borbonicus TaxID=1629725 RepID=A0A0T6BHC3_9SCAR|nr:hypothetical protein AMK59_2504 [Oryctes borbonicus]